MLPKLDPSFTFGHYKKRGQRSTPKVPARRRPGTNASYLFFFVPILLGRMEAYRETKISVALVKIDTSVTNEIRHRRAQIHHKETFVTNL